MALPIERDLLRQLGNKLGAFRPWTNKGHVTQKHVPQLRQFIESRPPEQSANRRYAGIARRGPDRSSALLRVRPHRTKLVNGKQTAVPADSLLGI